MQKAVQSFYSESRACVWGESGVNELFDVNVGLRQGCGMSPWLFNMYIDGVVRDENTRVQRRGEEFYWTGGGNFWKVNQQC